MIENDILSLGVTLDNNHEMVGGWPSLSKRGAAYRALKHGRYSIVKGGGINMTMDVISIASVVLAIVGLVMAVFEIGVAVGKTREKIDRLDRSLDNKEHIKTRKNDRR